MGQQTGALRPGWVGRYWLRGPLRRCHRLEHTQLPLVVAVAIAAAGRRHRIGRGLSRLICITHRCAGQSLGLGLLQEAGDVGGAAAGLLRQAGLHPPGPIQPVLRNGGRHQLPGVRGSHNGRRLFSERPGLHRGFFMGFHCGSIP